jgi:hypothetical protein
MATPVVDLDDSESGREMSSGLEEPSARQEEILKAYVESPNAAAVSRALKESERNVRRVVKRFEDRLRELREERNREGRERAHARQAMAQEWADAALAESLSQLDSLAVSKNEGVALRAIQMKLDLALRMPPATYPTDTKIALDLEALERRVARRIADIELGVADEVADGD